MKLTNNFHLQEFTVSETASRKDIDNTPSIEAVKNLTRVAHTLEIVRAEFNSPVVITSGYRSKRLNSEIGGSKNSYHKIGLAADFIIPNYSVKEVVSVVRNIVGFDQLINEYNQWIHIGLSNKLRYQVFEIL